MTRTGKIGRLPYRLRNELNEKIRDGVPGREILDWLNATKEARAVVTQQFEGRPISEQNLTEWKAGGYLDWERHMEATEWVENLIGKTEELADKMDRNDLWRSLADRVSMLVAVELGRSLEEVAADSELSSLERVEAILKINTATEKLRRGDHSRKRLAWQAECKLMEYEAEEEDKRVEAAQKAYSSQLFAAHMQQHEQRHAERMEVMCREAEAAAAKGPAKAKAPAPPVSKPEMSPAPMAAPATQGGGEVWARENGGPGPQNAPGIQGESGPIKVNQPCGDTASRETAVPVENPEPPVEVPVNYWEGYPWNSK
jgi:hypothetical protein